MCYSGKCKYEVWDGNCRIVNYKKYENIVGFSPCYIGSGQCVSEEEAKVYEENKQFFDELCQLTYDRGIVKI